MCNNRVQICSRKLVARREKCIMLCFDDEQQLLHLLLVSFPMSVTPEF